MGAVSTIDNNLDFMFSINPSIYADRIFIVDGVFAVNIDDGCVLVRFNSTEELISIINENFKNILLDEYSRICLYKYNSFGDSKYDTKCIELGLFTNESQIVSKIPISNTRIGDIPDIKRKIKTKREYSLLLICDSDSIETIKNEMEKLGYIFSDGKSNMRVL